MGLQGRGMRPLVRTFGMIHTWSARHHHDAGELLPAILAGVLLLLRAFIQLVAALVGAVGVTGASGGCELADIGELLPAILTITILSFHGH